MYRYERPGLGRNREFTQFGVECLGSDDEMMDAEVISFSYNILKICINLLIVVLFKTSFEQARLG